MLICFAPQFCNKDGELMKLSKDGSAWVCDKCDRGGSKTGYYRQLSLDQIISGIPDAEAEVLVQKMSMYGGVPAK
jgi:DNA-directed RNA polymerase subunit M/transcription elongation factor TFIIS